MKHIKTVTVPETTREVVERVTCDICKAEIKPGPYDAEEVKVSCRTGSNYPEGGNGEEMSFDICRQCFEEKLIPFLESLGALPDVKAWDW